jgi:beta-lactamase class D
MIFKRFSVAILLLLPFTLTAQRISKQDFSSHFQEYGVEGTFVWYDLQNKKYIIHNRARGKKGFIPASTFKIPNSLIALELGVVADENTIMKWDGTERSIAAWNKDMTFGNAIKVSCVPCYQEIARKVGVKGYRELLKKLRFGKMDIAAENIDMFWLRGKSQITPMQQVDFLVRLYENDLKISQRSMDIVKSMLVLEEQVDYVLRGKTGWAVDGTYNVGWFVGWVEKDGKPYFFATNVDATNPDEAKFIQSRVGITNAILKELLPVN